LDYNRILQRMIKNIQWLFLLSLLVVSEVGFGQAVPTPQAPRIVPTVPVAYAIYHETDAQKSIEISWDATVTISGAAGWTITVGGAPVVPIGSVSSGVGAASKTTIILPTAIGLSAGVGQLVTVQWAGGMGANAFGPTPSVNRRPIICTDFAFASYNDASGKCAPVDPISQMVFSVIPAARNSENWNLTKITTLVTWINDPITVPFSVLYSDETNSGGTPMSDQYHVGFSTADYDASLNNPASPLKYAYPAADVVCGYTSKWNVRLTFASAYQGKFTVCPILGGSTSQPYDSFNNDDTGVGAAVVLDPTVLNTDLVCRGTNVNMTFNDNTDLNCNPALAPAPAHAAQRWVRVVYGSTDLGGGNTATSNIPFIEVDGIPVTDFNGILASNLAGGGYVPPTYPFGVPDGFGVVLVPAAVNNARGILNLVTTSSPVGQVLGQKFWVRIDYWNQCNPYDGFGDIGNVRESVESEIEIVDIPLPPTAVDDIICQGDGLGGVNFIVTGTAGSSAINWYDGEPSAGGVLITGGNSTTFPASSFPGGLDANIPGNYSMWATYVIGATNSCESDPVEITITVKEDLTQPGAITGSSPICNNTNDVSFSVAAAAGSTPFGGVAEYQWNSTGGTGVSFDAATGSNITVDFSIPGSFTSVTRTIRVRRIYSTAPTCPSNYRTFTVTIFGETLGGTTNPDNSICEGDNTGIIALTGENGTILNWERQKVLPLPVGAVVNIGNGTFDSFSEILNTAGTYEYAAVIENGLCATERSTITTITVNPVPVTPTISEVGDGTDICANGDQVILQSSNADGNADEYAWFKDPDFVTPVQQTNSNQLTITTPAQSGRYYVKVIGINPTNCESSLSAPIDIVINPLPTAVVSGGGSVCGVVPGPASVITMTGTGPYDVTYERDGNPTTVNGITSPYSIPGSTLVVDGLNDTYVVTSITDLGTTINCTVNAPSGNISGTATIAISAVAAPTIDNYVVGNAVCDDGATTTLPSITLDLFPNSSEDYEIEFEVRDGTLPAVANFSKTITKTTDAAGVLVFTTLDLDYVADLASTPDTYQIRLISIVNTASGCNAAGLPANQNLINLENPRPLGVVMF
jgi:hypothetical protein